MKTRLYKIEGMSKQEIECIQRMIEESRDCEIEPGITECRDDNGEITGYIVPATPWTAFKARVSYTIENIRYKTRYRIKRVKSN